MAIVTSRRIPQIITRKATAVSYVSQGEGLIAVTNTAAPRTITLSDADKIDCKEIDIKDESGGAGTNNITISPQSGTIDGAASVVISANYGVARVYSNGTNWFTR